MQYLLREFGHLLLKTVLFSHQIADVESIQTLFFLANLFIKQLNLNLPLTQFQTVGQLTLMNLITPNITTHVRVVICSCYCMCAVTVSDLLCDWDLTALSAKAHKNSNLVKRMLSIFSLFHCYLHFPLFNVCNAVCQGK